MTCIQPGQKLILQRRKARLQSEQDKEGSKGRREKPRSRFTRLFLDVQRDTISVITTFHIASVSFAGRSRGVVELCASISDKVDV
jgi:hypothetical protein